MGYRLGALSCMVAAGLLGGCGKDLPPPIVQAEGTILLDGKPLNKAEVRFIPVDEVGAEYIAKGVTDEQGRFKLMCKGQPGACAGENYVIVKEADIPPRLRSESAQKELDEYLNKTLGNRPIPAKYSNVANSPLRATLSTDSKTHYFFELKRDN
jgi:hypothetical protein